MALTKQEIQKLARLARIELTPAEEEKFSEQISSILDYVKQVQEVDTAKVKTPRQQPNASAFRPDDIKVFPAVKDLISQWPEKSGNLNKVKSVLE